MLIASCLLYFVAILSYDIVCSQHIFQRFSIKKIKYPFMETMNIHIRNGVELFHHSHEH